MADVTGFLKHDRQLPARRPVPVRIQDWREVYQPTADGLAQQQASRCMDCGIPFCHNGCPLGNLIPEWNDLVYSDRWRDAVQRLHATNNFPEFTGRLCPAPCEASCVLGISQQPVAIEQVEKEIIEHAWANGWVVPVPPNRSTGHRVAVIGSGPGRAGRRAAADPGRASGHRLRTCRSDRGIAALRHPGVQAGEAGPGPADPAIGRGGNRNSGPGWTSGSTSRWHSCGPSSTRCCWPAAPPPGGTCRFPAGS